VVGGGDVAIDSARMAFRLGAEVTVVYRRTREEMPAIATEIKEAEEEGIHFQFLALPERIEGNGKGVEKLVCRQMKLGEYSIQGRRQPESTDELIELDVDTVIAAIGQQVEADSIAEQTGIELGRGKRIPVDPFTLATDATAFYAGGDAVTGPSIVLEAVGAGERAAVAINRKLMRDVPAAERPEPFWRRTIGNDIRFDPDAAPTTQPRLEQDTLPMAERCSLAEVELAIGKEAAVGESLRCMRCDYRGEDS